MTRTEQVINVRGNCSFCLVDGETEIFFPLLNLRARAGNEDDAFSTLRHLIGNTVNNGTEEIKDAWNRFCHDNIIERDMSPEDEANESEIQRSAHVAYEELADLDWPQLKEVLRTERRVLIDFFGDTCRPCQVMAPIVAAAARELQGRVRVATLNIDLHEGVRNELHIDGIPSLLLFHEGTEVLRLVGTRSKYQLLRELADQLDEMGKVEAEGAEPEAPHR